MLNSILMWHTDQSTICRIQFGAQIRARLYAIWHLRSSASCSPFAHVYRPAWSHHTQVINRTHGWISRPAHSHIYKETSNCTVQPAHVHEDQCVSVHKHMGIHAVCNKIHACSEQIQVYVQCMHGQICMHIHEL